MTDRHFELPAHPNLEYYRKQAKHLHRTYETGDAAAQAQGSYASMHVYFATEWHMGFAIPMMIGTTIAAGSVFASMLFSPETKGTELTSDIQLA